MTHDEAIGTLIGAGRAGQAEAELGDQWLVVSD